MNMFFLSLYSSLYQNKSFLFYLIFYFKIDVIILFLSFYKIEEDKNIWYFDIDNIIFYSIFHKKSYLIIYIEKKLKFNLEMKINNN